RDTPGRFNRLAQFDGARKGLEDQQVNAGLEQRLDLLHEDGPRLLGRDRADRRQRLADAADRAGQEHVLAADLSRLACDFYAAEVDVPHALLETVRGKRDAIGRE